MLQNTQWDKELQKQVYSLINITIKQNHFKVNDDVWQQIDGLPMSLPVSSIVAEIFQQDIENSYYPNVIKNRHTIYHHVCGWYFSNL